jgi:hypothetical protein
LCLAILWLTSLLAASPDNVGTYKLKKTLEEERQTDEKLTKLAKEINAQANEVPFPKELDESKTSRRTPKHAA